MKFNWKTPLTALGGMGAAVGMLVLARSPAAANPGMMYAAAAITSQLATAFGFIGSRFDQLRERERVSNRNDIAANASHGHERADRDDPEPDTEPGSGEDSPTRLPEALDQQLGEDLEKIVQANKRGDHAEVEALAESVGRSNARAKQAEDIDRMVQAHKRGDRAEVAALLENVRQSAAELRKLEATPEPAGPSHENASRGTAPPKTKRQDAQSESEQAGASDDAQRTTDDRAATTPRAGHASDADERGAQTERNEASSRARSPDEVPPPAEPNDAPDRRDDQRQTREASAGEAEGAETEGQRPDADPARQDTQSESEPAGAPDDAELGRDHRAATTPRASYASDAETRRAAGAQTERGEASSRVSGPDDVPHPAEANEAPDRRDDQRQTREAAGEAEGVETQGERPDADPRGPFGTEHDVAAGERVEQSATSRDEGESPAPATDKSAGRVSAEAGSEAEPPSPKPVSEPSREPWVPTGRYPGSGVTAEQLRAMQGPAPKFDPPEAVTDAASRKQAALAAMTRDRTGVAEGRESRTAQPDQGEHPEPTTGADPGPPARDREME